MAPGAVVKVGVVVGDLRAVQPVDGDARPIVLGVRPRIGTGIDRLGAAEHTEVRPVGADGGVPGTSFVLHEGVVGGEVFRGGVTLAGGDEKQPEGLAEADPFRNQAPVPRDHDGRTGDL